MSIYKSQKGREESLLLYDKQLLKLGNPELRKRQLFLSYNSFSLHHVPFRQARSHRAADPLRDEYHRRVPRRHLRVGVYRHHLAQHGGPARAHAARRPASNGAAQQGLRRSHSHHDDVHLRVQRHPRSLRPGEVYLALVRQPQVRHGETVAAYLRAAARHRHPRRPDQRHARGRHRLEPSVRRIRHLWLQKRRRLSHHDDHRHRVRRAARHVARPVQIPAARGHQRL